MPCHHLHLTERHPIRPTDPPTYACADCRSIVGTFDLPASHRRVIRYLPISVHSVNTEAAELVASLMGDDISEWTV